MQRAMSVFNWYADGVVVLDDQVLCIEAKLRATPSAVSQVEFYLQQMMRTPELQKYMNRPFVPVVLWAIDDPAVSAYARGRGVRVAVYTPSWIEDWMQQVLRIGRQRLRAAAALELAIMRPGEPLFEVRAPGFRQQEVLHVPITR